MDVGIADAGQSCDEPAHREEEGRLHQDVLAETMAYGDQPLTDGTLTQLIRTPPEQTGRFLEDVAVCLDFVARVAACRRPKGANFLSLGC